MQDFLPDVPKDKQESLEDEAVVGEEQTAGRLGKLRKLMSNRKQRFRLVVVLGLGALVGLGILATILEKAEENRSAEVEVEKGEFADWLLSVEQKPGQMSWGFYLDENANGEFEYNEQLFSGVSVSIRRPGEEQAFRTEASGSNGVVIIDDLAVGEYEVRIVNYELEQVGVYGDFELPNFYELVDENRQRFEFIPSEWKSLSLGEEGYKGIMGVREYRPERLLVLTDGSEVSFYDPDRAKIYGQSVIKDGVKRKFLVKDNLVVYIKDDQLKKFSFKDRTEAVVVDRLYGVDEVGWALSPEMKTVVYTEEEELRYKTEGEECGEGAIIYNGQRVNLKQELELVVDFWDEQNLVLVGMVKGGDWQVFKGFCGERQKLAVEPLEIGEVRNLYVLEDKTLFYINSQGSYFYDLDKKEATKYVALGVPSQVKLSVDKKYIVGKLGGNYIVVDYPAVKASGVEKHYVIGVNNLVVVGDEGLVSRAKACEADGDCGEIVRIELKGNGAWEWGEAVDLKDVVVKQVLGEIEL